MPWEKEINDRCPHKFTFEDRVFLGRCRGWEVYQCPICGYIYLGAGVPLAYFLEAERRLLELKRKVGE